MSKTRHNPEKRAWRGRSYKRGGARVRDLLYEADEAREITEQVNNLHAFGTDDPEEIAKRVNEVMAQLERRAAGEHWPETDDFYDEAFDD